MVQGLSRPRGPRNSIGCARLQRPLGHTLLFAGVVALLCVSGPSVHSAAGELIVGTATADITPPDPVALMGQWNLRISKRVDTTLTANVLAVESREGQKSLDAAVMISCDLVWAPPPVLKAVRENVRKRLPDLDVTKIFISGTHTHTSPVLMSDEGYQLYQLPEKGVMKVEDYHSLLVGRIADAVVKAWNARTPGSLTWGLGHAVVAYNRRIVYADGHAKMYGRTDLPEFRNLEACEDHDVGTLFFWNKAGKLLSIVVNVSCPSQEVEHMQTVNADYWHPVRERLHKTYGPDVCILSWCGAAGDQSPHLRYRRAADDRMTRLRGLDRMDEIARRIGRAVDEAYEAVSNDRHPDAPLVHKVETVRLPMWPVTDAQYAEAKAEVEQCADQIAKDPKAVDRCHARMKWNELLMRRYEHQQTEPNPMLDMELHVLRIGDAVICTNRFELFTDYGIRIKARSKAEQTFVVQLAGEGSYLPTEKAVQGGGYSAIAPSCLVGPEGGQVLVDRTVELINSLWTK